jgi:hypothetical protein
MIWQKHIAAMGNSWLLLNETSKTCSSKIFEPIGNQLFVGMMFVWSSTKILSKPEIYRGPHIHYLYKVTTSYTLFVQSYKLFGLVVSEE